MSKVAFTSFTGNRLPDAINIVSGVAVMGAGRRDSNAWGLSLNTGAGQAEVSVAVPAATTGVRGTFYTRAIGGQTFPMDLVKVGLVDLFLSDASTLRVRINGAIDANLSTLANAIFAGFTNEISFSVDLHASTGAVTFIVNGTTLNITGLNTVTTGVSSLSLLGMNGTRAGSALMDICVYDDAGATFNGIPPFVQCRRSGTSGGAGTFTDWLASGTIPSTPKNTITVTPTIPDNYPMYVGYSPIQKKHYWVSANIWTIVDVSNASAAPVLTYNTTISRPANLDNRYGDGKTAIYVQLDDRIYYSASDGLRYFDCAAETGSAVLDANFNDVSGFAYDYDEHKLYCVSIATTVQIFDIPSATADTSIVLSSSARSAAFAPSCKLVYFLRFDKLSEIDPAIADETAGSPYAVVDASSTNLVYNPTMGTVTYHKASDSEMFDCGDKTVTSLGFATGTTYTTYFDPQSGAVYRTLNATISGRQYHNGVLANTLVSPFSSGSRFSMGVFDSERSSYMHFNTERTSFVEETIFTAGTPTANEMIIRADDVGRIASASNGDKHSVRVNRDKSAFVTTPVMIGINLFLKNVTGDNSILQVGLVDGLGNKNSGATIVTTATSQDIARTEFTNSQGGDLTLANVDDMELSIEAV